nr:SOT5 [Ilex asprella]
MESSHEKNAVDQYSSLPKDTWWGERELYQYKGQWFVLPYLQAAQEVANNFKPLPTDIILASFPKTGTTWLKSLLYSIVHRSSKESLTMTHPQELIPSLESELYGPQKPNSSHIPTAEIPKTGTRIFSTHICYQVLADTINSSECKVVYVTRNPKDTLISFWHFMKAVPIFEKEPWELEVATEKFCRGVVPYGPFYEHVLDYWKVSSERPQKVLFLTYEELKKDTKAQVKKLAEFLGFSFEGDAEKVDEEVEEIVNNCSIETLKNREVNKSSDLPNWGPLAYNSYFRKGKVGDHKNHLKPEMIERIDAITLEKFHGSGLMFGI